jgi:MFS transporter, DHA1 family, multidrug resistance protein
VRASTGNTIIQGFRLPTVFDDQKKMLSSRNKSSPSFIEFVIVITMTMSLAALSTDMMLPALAQIGSDLGVRNANDRQLIVSLLFLGLAIGQIFFGPLSDKTGRKPAIYLGYVLFISGALLSVFSINFPMTLAGRLLQGIGISAPRSVTLALVRDRFEGRAMARVMSFVMTVFILVPMIAPSFGQAILLISGWRAVFVALVLMAIFTLVWFAIRIPETLEAEKRAPFKLGRIAKAMLEVLRMRTALGYTISAGLVAGAFIGYLNSAQQIYQEQYALGERFPIYFGVVAFSIGVASFLNARLVMRFGMRFLVRGSLRTILLLAVLGFTISQIFGGQPPFWFLMSYLMLSFFCIGILFGNQNSLAMEPLGHLAGVGAAVVGSLSTLIATPLGTVIGQSYNGTVLPLIMGLGVLALFSIFVVEWAEIKNDQRQGANPVRDTIENLAGSLGFLTAGPIEPIKK